MPNRTKPLQKNAGLASKQRAINRPENATTAGIQSWQNERRKRPRNPHHTPQNNHVRMAGPGCDV